MSRWKAAGIHMLLSIVVGIVVAVVLFGLWYPPPYFAAGGADRLMLLLLGIDLAFGPLLTLIVFKSGKSSLTFDLSVIALVQVTALAYGVFIMCQSRPVFIVAVKDRFNVVAANQFDKPDLDRASKPEFGHLSWTGPKLVATRRPFLAKERTELLHSGLAGRDIEVKPQYFVPYEEEAKTILERVQPLSLLREGSSAAELKAIDSALQELGKPAEAVGWLPIVARRAALVMLIDNATGMPLKAIAVDPW